MGLENERDRGKLSAAELKEQILNAQEEVVAAEPSSQEKETGVQEQVTPADSQPKATPKAEAEGEPTQPVEKVAPTPEKSGKVEDVSSSYDELAKKSGFKSKDDLAKSYLELRRQRDRERQKEKATPPPAAPIYPQAPPVGQYPNYPQGGYYGGQANQGYSEGEALTYEQFNLREQKLREDAIIYAQIVAEQEAKKRSAPLEQKLRQMEEDKEIQMLINADPLYGTEVMQKEIDKAFEENPWLDTVPNKETVAYKIARGSLNNSTPPVFKQEPQQATTPGNVDFVEGSSPASPHGDGASEFDTTGKSAAEISAFLKKQGVKHTRINEY